MPWRAGLARTDRSTVQDGSALCCRNPGAAPRVETVLTKIKMPSSLCDHAFHVSNSLTMRIIMKSEPLPPLPKSTLILSTVAVASASLAYMSESLAWRWGLGLLCLATIILWTAFIFLPKGKDKSPAP